MKAYLWALVCFVCGGSVVLGGGGDGLDALRVKVASVCEGLSVSPNALPGCVLATGEGSVPLVFGRSCGTDVSVAAAAVCGGKGRVVAVGHTAFFTGKAASDPQNQAFLRECLTWLAGGREPETIYLDVRQRELLPMLEHVFSGLALKTVDRYDELEKLPATALLVTFPDSHPLADAPRLSAFLKRGGRAFCFVVAWGWHQISGGKSFATENPFNAAFVPFGLFVTGLTVDGNLAGNRYATASGRSFPGATVKDALALGDSEQAVDKEAVERSARMLGEWATVLPKEETVWRSRLQDFANASARFVPSPGQPLGEATPRERLGYIVYQNLWQQNPGRKWKAHPAAKTYPGLPTGGARVTREVEVDLGVPRWHGTGLFAGAGEPLTLTLPEGAERLGLRCRVGTTSCNLTGAKQWSRAPLVTVELPLDKPVTTFSSPFGGLVYVVVPNRAKGQGSIRVKIGPACSAARFVEGRDTPESWREALRTSSAPFAEIENDVIALTVPLEAARNASDPRELLALWRQILKDDARLTGIPEKRECPERMCFDVQLCAGYMHSGYPIMLPKHTIPYLLNIDTMRKGDVDEVWGFFHEMGHNHQNYDWTFDGAVEVTVNFFSLYNMEKICGKLPRQTAKMGDAGLRRRVEAWKAAGRPFDEWKRDPFLALDFFVELRLKYGWEAFEKLFAEYRTLPEAERPKNDLEKRRQWCRRFSRIVGEDLTDEFSFMFDDRR